MNPNLLSYYNRELQHVREMGGEFAREFPKVAGRLGLEGFECADPYVERLLEGFAFLTARVQLKLDEEFPRFTQGLLEMVYPHYLAPMPSMAMVELQPDPGEGALKQGVRIARDTALLGVPGEGDTACEYRTAHDITLWPLELVDAEYYGYTHDLASLGVVDTKGGAAALRIRLRCTGDASFDQLALENLVLHLRGPDELPMHLYEQLLACGVRTLARTEEGGAWSATSITTRPMGFEEDEALLPHSPRTFEGYRLLREYFAFPQRYLMVELGGLGPIVRRAGTNELDLLVLLDRSDPVLERAVDRSNFMLFCTPAINLFPRRADRIHLNRSSAPFHIVPDRTRPQDFEIYEVTAATGHGTGSDEEQAFTPFYACTDESARNGHAAYYSTEREPRRSSAAQNGSGSRTSYVGSEVFVSLVDGAQAPYASALRQLAVKTLCTNRDLPLLMPVGRGDTDFTLESGAPVLAVRCVAGPTAPKPAGARGETAWRLISHLSLNYLSLIDSDEAQGAAALRELLTLYADLSEPALRRQVDGVRSIEAKPVTRRLPVAGPISFGRGLEITLTFDEAAFTGSGAFLLGAVLERFFAKYVSINTFTETVVRTLDRGELIRWPARTGTRQTL